MAQSKALGNVFKLNSIVNVKDPAYGAKGDDSTDDTTAITNAIATGKSVFIPAGTYRISSTLVLANAGQKIYGEGRDDSVIKATAAIKMMRVSAERVRLEGFSLNGNSTATNALVMHNGARAVVDISVSDCTSHGVVFNNSETTPTGNNNLAKFYNVVSNSNGGCGFACPNNDSDNNGIEFLFCEASSNTSHGLLYKGQGMRLIGGIYQDSGGYGIQISESGDGSFSTGSFIFYPWLESNASGGIRGGGKSVRNIVFRDQGMQSLTLAAGSEDCEFYADNSSGPIFTIAQGRLSVAAGQIVFPATQSASTNANTLDDYEEGTWTPAVTFATPGDLNVAYSTQVGIYTKIGRQVTISFSIVTSTFTHSTASGVVRITGLPFTAWSSSSAGYLGGLAFRGITKANYTNYLASVGSGAALATVNASGSAVSNDSVTTSDMPTGGTVILSSTVTYNASA